LAGQAQVMSDVTPSSTPHIRAGKLRAPAVTTATRSDVLPEHFVFCDPRNNKAGQRFLS
jgi:tripartite-type tricarboxylate transporter receptor subunit TctC